MVDHRIRNRRKNKRILIEYKGGKCAVCGLKDDCNEIYDFHHIDEKLKDFNIAHGSLNLEKQKKEVDKCLLLCSNCHRRLHSIKMMRTGEVQ
jgi:5-methylcytosine-specific restriction endonuclease McrA